MSKTLLVEDETPTPPAVKEERFFDAEVEKAAGTNDALWFTASTEDRDRHGDVVVAESWKTRDYMKNPVFLWAHDYYKPPIGKTLSIEKGNGKLRQKIQFVPAHIDPFAEQIKQLYLERYMRTVSVGFMVYKREPLTEEDKKQRPEKLYGERLHGDLLELSAVPVPANPNALQNCLDAVRRGFDRKGNEPLERTAAIAVHPDAEKTLSPHLRIIGDVAKKGDSLRWVRASAAYVLGARGGFTKDAKEQSAQWALLVKASEALGDNSLSTLTVPPQDDQERQEFLREAFADVWDGELLDLVAQSKAIAPAEPASGLTPEQEKMLSETISGMTNTLDAVKAVLK